MIHLVVVHNIGEHSRGSVLTDPEFISHMLEHHPASVVKINAPEPDALPEMPVETVQDTTEQSLVQVEEPLNV